MTNFETPLRMTNFETPLRAEPPVPGSPRLEKTELRLAELEERVLWLEAVLRNVLGIDR